jgi:hypothetical protein
MSTETIARFEYGTSGSYGATTPDTAVGAGDDLVSISAAIDGLEPSTSYHFRVVADNGVGEPVLGPDQTFTTADPPPTPTISQATGTGTQTATVHGTVDTHGFAGGYRVQVVQSHGTYSRAFAETTLAAVDGPQDVSAVLSDLPPGRTYTARISATTSGGTLASDSMEFSTAPLPPFVPEPQVFVDQSPYGCANPTLNPRDGEARPGRRVSLTGTDLGAYGTVAVGRHKADVVDYSSTKITIVVPTGVKGTLPVTVNCSKVSNTIALEVTRAPSNRFTLDLARVTGAKIVVKAKLPGKGTLSVRGSGIHGVVKRAGGKGAVTIGLMLTQTGKTQLRRSKSGKLQQRITVRYRPAGGTTRSTTRTVTFERR